MQHMTDLPMDIRQWKRRDFLLLLGSGWLIAPFAASAQQPNRAYRLAFLTANPRDAPQHLALLDELRRYGFLEGQNLIIDRGGFSTDYDKFSEAAAALIKSPVDAVVCSGEVALRAAQRVTRTVPVLGVADDMLAAGLVHSLAKPGGNITGISIFATELDGKRQELLMEVVPNARRMAVLADPNSTDARRLRPLEDAARASNVELSIQMVDNADKIVPAIDLAKAAGAQAINFLSTPLFSANRSTVIQRAIAQQLPSMHHWPEIAEDGGLAGYGLRLTLMYRQMGRLLANVLRGTAPADLPVEQPATFELVVNLRTAKALGIEVPPMLLARADKVVE
jgi:putative tryptophan/tyrosine transport system substrate-binding protein